MTSRIIQVTLNTDLLDQYEGEYTLPPMGLKIKDLKESYNVQTAYDALVYFNYLVHNEEITTTIDKLLKVCEKVMYEELFYLNKEYASFCELTNLSFIPYKYHTNVFTFGALK